MQVNEAISAQKDKSRGSIEVICGSMFSGKTEELIKQLKHAIANGLKVQIFSPAIDTRYSKNAIVSHDLNSIPAIPVTGSNEILVQNSLAQVIGIDEAQFFDNDLPGVCNTLAHNGARVIIAGLDMDYTGKPFGPVPELMAMAETVTKLHATCVICGRPAQYSYRTVPDDHQVLLGEKESYEPRCRECYYK